MYPEQRYRGSQQRQDFDDPRYGYGNEFRQQRQPDYGPSRGERGFGGRSEEYEGGSPRSGMSDYDRSEDRDQEPSWRRPGSGYGSEEYGSRYEPRESEGYGRASQQGYGSYESDRGGEGAGAWGGAGSGYQRSQREQRTGSGGYGSGGHAGSERYGGEREGRSGARGGQGGYERGSGAGSRYGESMSGRGRQESARGYGWAGSMDGPFGTAAGAGAMREPYRGDDFYTPRHSGKAPKGYKRSDERIQEEVNDRLMRDDDLDPSDIEVKVKDGEVTLTGTVESRSDKLTAEDLACAVMGVTEVINHVRIKKQSGGGSGGGSSAESSESSSQKAQSGTESKWTGSSGSSSSERRGTASAPQR